MSDVLHLGFKSEVKTYSNYFLKMMSVSQAGDILYLEAIDSSLRMCLSDVGVSKAKSKYVKERNANVVGVVLVQHSNTVCFIFHTNRATEKRAYENLIYLSFPCCTIHYTVHIYVSDG